MPSHMAPLPHAGQDRTALTWPHHRYPSYGLCFLSEHMECLSETLPILKGLLEYSDSLCVGGMSEYMCLRVLRGARS